jgi:hypothetical protein
MKLRYSLGAVAVGLIAAGCGLGDDANVGDDSTNQNIGKSGAGGEGAGGATHNTGGSAHSTGATYGAGGATHGTGGATENTGGVVSSGGASHAAGGATQNTGGATQNTGGSAGGVPCGKKTCAATEICCSPSCGICGAHGGLCPAIACVPDPVTPADAGVCVQNVACVRGTSWSPTACKCVPESGTCNTAADCHLTADYCDGCNCLALSQGQTAPACSGQTVACLVDPCQLKNVACVNNRCVAQ